MQNLKTSFTTLAHSTFYERNDSPSQTERILSYVFKSRLIVSQGQLINRTHVTLYDFVDFKYRWQVYNSPLEI